MNVPIRKRNISERLVGNGNTVAQHTYYTVRACKDIRHKAVALTLLLTGMHCCELCGLAAESLESVFTELDEPDKQ